LGELPHSENFVGLQFSGVLRNSPIYWITLYIVSLAASAGLAAPVLEE